MTEAPSGPIDYGLVFVPDKIELDGEWLTWKLPGNSSERNWRKCTAETLLQFAKVETPAEVVEFAKKYGVLGAKQLPADSPRVVNELRTRKTRWCVSAVGGVEDREPLALWFMLARQARAVLRIGSVLQGRTRSRMIEPGSDEDWQALDGSNAPRGPEELEDSQFWLMHVVNEWLRSGQVGFRLGVTKFSRERVKWTVEIGCGDGWYNLFGHLALQLFLMVARVGRDKLYTCSGCGFPYLREKKAPRAGQDNFCPDCTDVAQVRAMERYRERKGGKRRQPK
jgi:hypothetical protein